MAEPEAQAGVEDGHQERDQRRRAVARVGAGRRARDTDGRAQTDVVAIAGNRLRVFVLHLPGPDFLEFEVALYDVCAAVAGGLAPAIKRAQHERLGHALLPGEFIARSEVHRRVDQVIRTAVVDDQVVAAPERARWPGRASENRPRGRSR